MHAQLKYELFWCFFQNLDMAEVDKSNKLLISLPRFQNCHTENVILKFGICADNSPITSAIMTDVKGADNPDLYYFSNSMRLIQI